MNTTDYIADIINGRVESHPTFEEAIRAREKYITAGVQAELEIEQDRQDQGEAPRTLAEIQREVGLLYRIETSISKE